jgi:hypothetical protein
LLLSIFGSATAAEKLSSKAFHPSVPNGVYELGDENKKSEVSLRVFEESDGRDVVDKKLWMMLVSSLVVV